MADLLTPKTWTSGEVPTASSMNSGIRDPINRLNGFADNITNSTAADSGTATYLEITRPAVFGTVLEGWVSGESFPRVQLTAGSLYFGNGEETANHALEYDDTIPGIKTLGIFQTRDLYVSEGPILFRDTPDDAATNQYIEFPSQLAPPTPSMGRVRIFAGLSNGVLRVLARFPNGTTRIMASEDGSVPT